MNKDRARWAETALQAFEAECMAGAQEDDQTIMADMVADLMHFCAQRGLEWSDILATASEHFEVEKLGCE